MIYNYYMKQLNRLDSNSDHPLSIKVYNDKGSTKQMNLNSESIPVLIEYLRSLQQSLDDTPSEQHISENGDY